MPLPPYSRREGTPDAAPHRRLRANLVTFLDAADQNGDTWAGFKSSVQTLITPRRHPAPVARCGAQRASGGRLGGRSLRGAPVTGRLANTGVRRLVHRLGQFIGIVSSRPMPEADGTKSAWRWADWDPTRMRCEHESAGGSRIHQANPVRRWPKGVIANVVFAYAPSGVRSAGKCPRESGGRA